MSETSRILKINSEDIPELFGNLDSNLSEISRRLCSEVAARGDTIRIFAKDIDAALKTETVLLKLSEILNAGLEITPHTLDYVISMVSDNKLPELDSFLSGIEKGVSSSIEACISYQGKPIRPKTAGQKSYFDAIEKNTITFGIGPAGTGKTYLAVCLAVKALKNRTVQRILLTRPAVEAGEKLGFLPGDLRDKIDPYLRPLYDALFDMLGAENFPKYQEKGIIEIAPLAYMRGRTLDNSFVILDEAQNTTREQMKMFLTRLGNGSKMVITGDLTQTDIHDRNGISRPQKSGLYEASKILSSIEGLKICYLTDKDVVRHRIVRDIIKAYEKPIKINHKD